MSLGEALNLASPEFAVPSEPPAWCDLIYKGKRHALSGPPEAAKTLLALGIALEAIRAGSIVAFIDFESGPAETRRLLEDLGATTDELETILYFEADGPPEGDDLLEKIVKPGAELAIIDAAAGAYDASGLNEMDRGDIEKFAKAWVRPLHRHGVATILIDHVVKNRNNRGAFAIGGERKLGGVDIHLGLSAVTQMSRGTSGLIKVTTHKDRPAWLPRPRTGDLELRSDPTTHAISWSLRPPSDETGGGWMAPDRAHGTRLQVPRTAGRRSHRERHLPRRQGQARLPRRSGCLPRRGRLRNRAIRSPLRSPTPLREAVPRAHIRTRPVPVCVPAGLQPRRSLRL